MKRALLIVIVVLIAIGALLFWKRSGPAQAKPAEAKEEEEPSRITHDELGRVVVKMDDETQGNMGLLVAKPGPAELSPELRGYGKVLDPAPLAALMNELAAAEAAASVSQAEFVRLKGLANLGNTSESKLQTAQATAVHDQLAVQSAKDRLQLSWGNVVAGLTNLPAFIQPLTLQTAVLIRIDLPAGVSLTNLPTGARVASLSGNSADAEFLGMTSSVDPQTLGRGAILLHKPNSLGLMVGEAVTGYLQMPGDPLRGVLIPSTALVRAEGRGWVYIMNNGSDAFTRMEVPLDRPLSGGWFVTAGVSTNDYLVTTGAQTLLSEELKSALKSE